MKHKLFIGILFLFLGSSNLFGNVLDSIKISLLTCSPASEIYTLFGHTAIRIEDKENKIDRVYNYGVFNFNSPNFIWRFVKGETDYQLGIVDYKYFEAEYFLRGSYVVQQTLNLLPEEKHKLIKILQTNYLPENRIYRYNYFFDNCTTRARDKIEESLSGELLYNTDHSPLTFRNIIYQYTENHKWARFGIDFCLGSEADQTIDYRQKMFAPFYLLNALEGSKIVREENTSDFIISTERIVEGFDEENVDNPFFSPVLVSWLFFTLILVISIIGVITGRTFWGIDLLLFGLAGIAGSLIAFLVFFSVHPTVSPNYLLIFLHPFHLIYLPFLVFFEIKKRCQWYHLLNLIILTIFILLWRVWPQTFNSAVLPLALCLLIRSASQLIISYKTNK